MSELMQPYFTWTNFFLAALGLWAFYVLLLFLQRRLSRGVFFGRFQQSITRGIATFLLLYEPFTVLLLTLVFFFINPLMHGILLVLLTLAGFGRIRDYLSGRIILATSLVGEGKRMDTAKASGVISRIGRIGLYLQTGDSLQFVNYSKLLVNGYSVATGEEVGGYYQLEVTVPDEKGNPLDKLADRLLTAPYLERSFRPELVWQDKGQRLVNARVSVREEQHLRELIDLMEEWGFPASLAGR